MYKASNMIPETKLDVLGLIDTTPKPRENVVGELLSELFRRTAIRTRSSADRILDRDFILRQPSGLVKRPYDVYQVFTNKTIDLNNEAYQLQANLALGIFLDENGIKIAVWYDNNFAQTAPYKHNMQHLYEIFGEENWSTEGKIKVLDIKPTTFNAPNLNHANQQRLDALYSFFLSFMDNVGLATHNPKLITPKFIDPDIQAIPNIDDPS